MLEAELMISSNVCPVQQSYQLVIAFRVHCLVQDLFLLNVQLYCIVIVYVSAVCCNIINGLRKIVCIYIHVYSF